MSLCDTCSRPGACCSGFVISNQAGSLTHWDIETRQQMRDDMKQRGLPFIPIAIISSHVDFETDKKFNKWAWGCPKLGADGRCTDYENRPQLCRDFEAGTDPLCVMHEPAP